MLQHKKKPNNLYYVPAILRRVVRVGRPVEEPGFEAGVEPDDGQVGRGQTQISTRWCSKRVALY